MKAVVKKEGLVIPKKFLKGIKEADIKWENGKRVTFWLRGSAALEF